jgi:hypothetical protein
MSHPKRYARLGNALDLRAARGDALAAEGATLLRGIVVMEEAGRTHLPVGTATLLRLLSELHRLSPQPAIEATP